MGLDGCSQPPLLSLHGRKNSSTEATLPTYILNFALVHHLNGYIGLLDLVERRPRFMSMSVVNVIPSFGRKLKPSGGLQNSLTFVTFPGMRILLEGPKLFVVGWFALLSSHGFHRSKI